MQIISEEEKDFITKRINKNLQKVTDLEILIIVDELLKKSLDIESEKGEAR